MSLTLLALGLAAGGATAGAIGGAVNNAKAKREESRFYNEAKNMLNSQYYRDPLSTVGNRSILKLADESRRDNMDALNNRAVAGGATFENQLAARQSNNETEGRLYAQLLQGEDARRQAIEGQKLALAGQHSANIQNQLMRSAQDWQSWGAQMGSAGMGLANTDLLARQNGVSLNLKDLIG